jgi:hypothetical protein
MMRVYLLPGECAKFISIRKAPTLTESEWASRNRYISGPFWGSLSSRWNQLAQSLNEVAARTKRPKLARWSRKYADELTKMAEDFRRREEEEELNRR